MTGRIDTTFANAKKAGRGTLGVFVTAGDPDEATSAALLDSLVENGADFIEIGMVPLNRAIYNQGSKANAFGFLASFQ